MALAVFASYLGHHNLIDIKRLRDESDDGFENRLKLQKYVYLAKRFENIGWIWDTTTTFTCMARIRAS